MQQKKLSPKQIEKEKQKNITNIFKHSEINKSIKFFHIQNEMALDDISSDAFKFMIIAMLNTKDIPLFPSIYCIKLNWYESDGKINERKFYEVIDELIIAGYIKCKFKPGTKFRLYEIADYPRFKIENEIKAKELEEKKAAAKELKRIKDKERYIRKQSIQVVECQIVSDEFEITHPDQINKTTVVIRDKKSIVYPKNYESSSEVIKIQFEKYIEDIIIKRFEAQKEKDIQMEKINDVLLKPKELEKKLNELNLKLC